MSEAREDFFHHLAVENASRKVLGARFDTALREKNLVSFFREEVGRNETSDATTDDDHIKVILYCHDRTFV